MCVVLLLQFDSLTWRSRHYWATISWLIPQLCKYEMHTDSQCGVFRLQWHGHLAPNKQRKSATHMSQVPPIQAESLAHLFNLSQMLCQEAQISIAAAPPRSSPSSHFSELAWCQSLSKSSTVAYFVAILAQTFPLAGSCTCHHGHMFLLRVIPMADSLLEESCTPWQTCA